MFVVLCKLGCDISEFIDNFRSIFPYEISTGSAKMSVWGIKKVILCRNFEFELIRVKKRINHKFSCKTSMR